MHAKLTRMAGALRAAVMPYAMYKELAMRYRTFKRSATNWQSFARARKYEDMRNLSYDEARQRCDYLNAQLTPAQKRRGTKYEFESQ